MKLDKQKWQTDFEKQLDIAEKPQLSKVKRFYKSEYNKGINSFIAEGQTNFELLFSENDFLKIYRDLYSDIGLRFAKWYAKNFDKYLTKGINPNEFVDQWQNSFASLGSAVGAQRVTLVSGTAKKTLIDLTQKLLRDPEFMVLGTIEKGRILRNQFNKYSAYQSRRLVQTEATNAANFATMESATTIFPGAQMMKEWIASFDDRTRSTHAEAGASEPIPYNDAFMVGGSLLMYPGDPSGPAAEVVNCRCSVAPFPKQGAQTVGELSGFNFGLAGAESTGFGLTDVAAAINTTLAGEVIEDISEQSVKKPKTLNEVANTNPNVPGNIVELFDNDSGLDLDLFSHFRKPQKLVIKNVRPNQQGGIVTTTKYKSLYETKKVYIHESGHFVADSRKWIVRGLVEKDSAVKPLTRIFDKWAKYSNNKANTQRLWKELNDIKPYESFDTLGKKLGYSNRSDYMADVGALKDTFGALTKEKIGGGHGRSYYKNKSFQWHEFIAHAYENKFQGNKLFKSLYRELYDDMIKMVDELNLNY